MLDIEILGGSRERNRFCKSDGQADRKCAYSSGPDELAGVREYDGGQTCGRSTATRESYSAAGINGGAISSRIGDSQDRGRSSAGRRNESHHAQKA